MVHLMGIRETFLDFPDNESLSVIVFTQGCSHGCKGCQNPSSQGQDEDNLVDQGDFLGGIIDRCKRNQTNKVVFSGGDPLFHEEGKEDQLKDVLKTVDFLEREGYECCVYTGYTLPQVERIYEDFGRGLKGPLYFKCGSYVETLKEPSWGKTDDSFVLVTKNQYFVKRTSEEEFLYEPLSKENRLIF